MHIYHKYQDKCENKNGKLLKSMVDDMSLQILNCIMGDH